MALTRENRKGSSTMIDNLILIDPGFHSFDGHQYNYLKNIVLSAQSRGMPCHILSNENATDTIKQEFSPVAAFNFLGVEFINDFSTNPTMNYNYNFFHFNLRFLSSLVAATQNLPPLDANTVAFFSTANFRHLLGILSWLDLFPETKRPRPVILLRDRDHLPERSAPLHRMMLPILASPRFRARLCSESPAMVAHYAGLAGSVVDLIPIPIDPERYRRTDMDRSKGAPVVAFLGQARLSKGFQLLPDILERLWTSHPDAEALVQTQLGEFDPQHDAPI
ncbi:MAG: hypothetical protein HYR63_24550 [Proteobacteria bacterium]|nr:hypothetical protein [Pseudomonadota bacterium]